MEIPLQIQPEVVDAFGIHLLDLINQLAPALLQVQALELSAILAARRRQAGNPLGSLRRHLMHGVPAQTLHQPMRRQPPFWLIT
ncbi:hypothetical protein D3C73_1480310 [compost metagenome]